MAPMGKTRGALSSLPACLIEHVLSLLSVPVLCRCRTVCKDWKELLAKPSFQKLWYTQSPRKPHLIITHEEGGWHPNTSGTTCFLDLDERRWYTIKTEYDNHDNLNVDASVMAIHDGLVCELKVQEFQGKARSVVVVFDPVAGNRSEIPLPRVPMDRWFSPEVAISVNDVTGSFNVFLFEQAATFHSNEPLLYVYESPKKNWRVARSPCRKQSFLYLHGSTFFRGRLYTVCLGCRFVWRLLSYDCDDSGDTWRVVSNDLTGEEIPRLVVSGDRLFLLCWKDANLWLHEVINGSLCQQGRQIITAEMMDNVINDIRFVRLLPKNYLNNTIPIIGSDGSCTSVVYVWNSGMACTYDLASRDFHILPESPSFLYEDPLAWWNLKYMRLTHMLGVEGKSDMVQSQEARH